MLVVLEHTGDGNLSPVKPSHRQEIIAAYKVGERVACDLSKRSRKQNSLLHAAIAKAFDNLPETETRFKDETHLRHWCFIRVGFHDTFLHRITDNMTPKDVQKVVDSIVGLRKSYKEHGIYTEIRAVEDGLALDIPKSWAFKRSSHRAATKVMDPIIDLLLELVPGMTREQLITAVRKDPT